MNAAWTGLWISGLVWLALTAPAFAIETAPRISDREIIERLTKLEEGQAHLRIEMNQRFDAVNQRFEDMNRRFDTLQWMLGLFITIAVAIFAAIARMLWLLSRAQAAQESVTASLKTEITSLKETDLRLMDQIKALIEHLKPPSHL
ncbi:hypothetical protein [Nitrospira sp. Kam-Ns4a]